MEQKMQIPDSTLACVHQGLRLGSGVAIGQASFSDLLSIERRPLPKIGLGMVLVRVEAAPVNPSDELYVRGCYGVSPKAGDVPGFEGCGTVVAANCGPYGWWLKGQRVSFGSQDGNGSWAEYVVISAFTCIPVSRRLPVEAAATLIVNPMTAIGLVERAKRHATGGIVVNAAGSALGRFLLPLAKQQGLTFVGTVRRETVRKDLLSQGADHVLNVNDPDYLEQLGQICRDCDVRVLLDAVGGQQTATTMKAMPDHSLVIVYGKLAAEGGDRETGAYPVAVESDALVFRNQRVEGYWLTNELHGFSGAYKPLLRAGQISKLYRRGVFTAGDYRKASLEQLISALDRPTGDGKLLYCNDQSTKRVGSVPEPHMLSIRRAESELAAQR
jgi:NADPH2:quinone reductase